MGQEVSKPLNEEKEQKVNNPDNEGVFREATKWVCNEAKKNPLLYELACQVMASPIRQIMNKSVQPLLLPIVNVIFVVVALQLKGIPDVLVAYVIYYCLRQLIANTVGEGYAVLSTSQKQLSQATVAEMMESATKAGAGEEVMESLFKAGAGEVGEELMKITTKEAAMNAAESALKCGALIDGVLLAFYTANDYWRYNRQEITEQEFQERFVCNTTSAIGSTTVGTAGAAAGAAIGTFAFPGIGTALGALAGNIVGGTLGATLGHFIGDRFSRQRRHNSRNHKSYCKSSQKNCLKPRKKNNARSTRKRRHSG